MVISINNTLIQKGRESVKFGVSGDISEAYKWVEPAFDSTDKLVALTFDDAPCDLTIELLDGLKKRNVSATFFVIGKNINSSNQNQIKRMIDEGHVVGNHSMSHIPLYHATKEDRVTPLDPEDDVLELRRLLKDKFCYDVFLLRVPGLIYAKSGMGNLPNGKYDAKSLSVKNNFVLVDTNTNFGDADGSKSTEELFKELFETKEGSIALLHVKPNSVKAVLKYIDAAREKGFEFVTVPELLMIYNKKVDLGVAYKSYNTYANLP